MNKLYTAPNPSGGTYEIGLKHIYTDKKGNLWYEYANVLQFPRTRELLATKALLGIASGINLMEFMEKAEAVFAAYSAGETVKHIENLVYLQERIGYTISEKDILELATIHFVLNDEPCEHYSTEFAQKKKEILETDDAAKDFFLSVGKQITQSLREQLKQDSPNSLTAKQRVHEAQKTSAYKLPN